MLKLPIFQKNKINQINQTNRSASPKASRANNPVSSSIMSQVQISQVSHSHMKSANINKKKAEFEKKIRKFIEADSPHQSIQQKKNNNQYSFENDTFHSHLHTNPTETDKSMKMASKNL